MTAIKLETETLNYIPKELTDFWRQYFSTLSIDLTKLFYKYTHENTMVRYMHRDIVKSDEYIQAVYDYSVIRSFKINPAGRGYLLFSEQMCSYLLNMMLGGQEDTTPLNQRLLSKVDKLLLDNILNDIMAVISKHFINSGFSIEPEAYDSNVYLLPYGKERISVQQFMIVTGSQSFVFDIAFNHKTLESMVLL